MGKLVLLALRLGWLGWRPHCQLSFSLFFHTRLAYLVLEVLIGDLVAVALALAVLVISSVVGVLLLDLQGTYWITLRVYPRR